MQNFAGFFILYIIKKKFHLDYNYSYEKKKKMKLFEIAFFATLISMLAWTTQATIGTFRNESVTSPNDYDFSHNTGVNPPSRR